MRFLEGIIGCFSFQSLLYHIGGYPGRALWGNKMDEEGGYCDLRHSMVFNHSVHCKGQYLLHLYLLIIIVIHKLYCNFSFLIFYIFLDFKDNIMFIPYFIKKLSAIK